MVFAHLKLSVGQRPIGDPSQIGGQPGAAIPQS
jgi:hypothetical protein